MVLANRVFVTDAHARSCISGVVSGSDLRMHGVMQIEDIRTNRQTQRELGAMYLLEPTNANIRRVSNDFRGKNPLYVDACVFFTRSMSEGVQARVARRCRCSPTGIKLRGC